MSKSTIRVVELFAGVGGFRLGLEQANNSESQCAFEVVWSNQWEPSTKVQHASKVYATRWPDAVHSNRNIAEVATESIPDHDLLVGGFPCQDYSVATTLSNSKGLIGKKGVLWWSIQRILSQKEHPPKYLFLENVDRLLKSPSAQRGRDFAVMLKSLDELGYAVEWRVINAADYGMPQRRRRVFFLGYHRSSPLYRTLKEVDKINWLSSNGVIGGAFPAVFEMSKDPLVSFALTGDLVEVSEQFNRGGKHSPFENTGIMLGGTIYTGKTKAQYSGPRCTLKDILQTEPAAPSYFIAPEAMDKWTYLKGAKNEFRKTKEGFEYHYNEGGMVFPDALDSPSRTIITGEGGKSASRFKHVIPTSEGLRRLTPIELERLNMFPDNHTQVEGISDGKRAFFMGNALVVGIVKKIAEQLMNQWE